MNYPEALEYLYNQLPMFHRVGKAAYKANLDNAIALDNYFLNPHKHYPIIHVAGTNGKGSVSHMLAAILQSAGYKTGLFTSPHLKDFRERIKVNGQMIGEQEVAQFVEQHQQKFNQVKPSFFEMTSALAFEYFYQCHVDIAIIEVGLGGRLDSTNIVNPVLSVITNISYDHCDLLGDSLEKIAIEKAGIIKPRVPVIIGEQLPETRKIFENTAIQNKADIYFADEKYTIDISMVSSSRKQIMQVESNGSIVFPNLEVDLKGTYQQKNICTVLLVIDLLKQSGWKIDDKILYNSLSNASVISGLMGRWHELGYNPLIVCDTGHNAGGMKWVVDQIATVPFKKLHIVIGFVNDKDISNILQLLPDYATYYFTQANIPRALLVEDLYTLAQQYNLQGNCYKTVSEAFISARNNAEINDFIFIGGSTFVVAEVL